MKRALWPRVPEAAHAGRQGHQANAPPPPPSAATHAPRTNAATPCCSQATPPARSPRTARRSRKRPTDPIGYRGLGLAYELKGDTAAAIRALRKYLKLAPDAADRSIISRRIERLSKSAGAK